MSPILNTKMVLALSVDGTGVTIEKGTNIKPLPNFEPLEDVMSGSVLLKVGDDVSTDEIMPAGAKMLPYRSNIPEISKFVYTQIDESFYARALKHQQ